MASKKVVKQAMGSHRGQGFSSLQLPPSIHIQAVLANHFCNELEQFPAPNPCDSQGEKQF